MNLKVENGMSSTQSVYYAHLKVSPGTIQDVKFVDDENIMLAIVDDCKFIDAHLIVARSLILTAYSILILDEYPIPQSRRRRKVDLHEVCGDAGQRY